jgi:hypothetical protein
MKSFTEYLFEKKDHIIKRLKKLSSEEKDILIAHFKKYPHKENMIDWNNKKLEFSDFDEVLGKVSTRQLKKRVKKSGIKGLRKGKDYEDVSYMFNDYYAYIPLNHKASKIIASTAIGSCTGKWCTAQNRADYWNRYTSEGITLVYLVHKDTGEKWAIAYDHINDEYELFDQLDDDHRNLPDENIRKILNRHGNKIGKYNKSLKQEPPDWLKRAKKSSDAKWEIRNNVVVWLRGTFKGTWKGGRFYNGTLIGNMEGGTLTNSSFFEGGNFIGTFDGGSWVSGNWNGGTWLGGFDEDDNWHIVSPDKWKYEGAVGHFEQLGIEIRTGSHKEKFLQELVEYISVLANDIRNDKLLP